MREVVEVLVNYASSLNTLDGRQLWLYLASRLRGSVL